jgi:Flp pilus assembly pilin Flp
MTKLVASLQLRLSREEGQTMAEYGVTLGVITILVVGAFSSLGDHVADVINNVATRF